MERVAEICTTLARRQGTEVSFGSRRFVWHVQCVPQRVFLCASQLVRQMIRSLLSDDDALRLEAASWFGKLLSSVTSAPIEPVVQCGFVPRFVQFLCEGDGGLQVHIITSATVNVVILSCVHSVRGFYTAFSKNFPLHTSVDQATWVLNNICAGTTEHTNAVISGSVVRELINLLSSPVLNVLEQAVSALGACCFIRVVLWSFDCLSR